MRAAWLVLLAGCAEEASELCADAPVTTWDNFGAGFLKQSCDTCHAASAPDRHGAPVAATFDSEEDVWALADRILVRATGEGASMPPQGGVPEDDRYRLAVWLSCGG